ncbi:MAG: NADH-quinone oxidoreductase subunit NuoE [Syntrophomonadaceae bacterium]|jgi:NADH-quinone oxidoreductase subunit E|nr:NADH-quinone oxidoreductase subunit NuoE [Syntrophomonadaceae bacterium]
MADEVIHADNEIRNIIQAYPPEKRFILAVMQDVQKSCNYLPKEALLGIAEYVGVPFSRVYSLATFYKAFSLTPKGRYNIKVCDGTACHIKGSPVLIDQIQNSLGIGPGETTADEIFSLETVNCLGACAIAPVMMVNDKVHPKVSSSAILEIIKGYRKEADHEE